MKNNLLKIIPLMLLVVLFSFYVDAFAVSMKHLADNTLVLSSGESSNFEITLQNMIGDQDELVQVIITEGSEIARIADKDAVYEVLKGTKNTKVNILLDIPDDAPLGTEWNVRFSADLVTGGGAEMVQISGSLSDGFKVLVGPLPQTEVPITKEKYPFNALYVIGGIILIVLIFLVGYKKKQGKKK